MATILNNLAVVGAGTMGADLAVRFAASGCKVFLMARPGRSRDSFAQRAQRSAADLGADISNLNIELVPKLEDLPWPELDLVIENVKEDLGVKQEVFRQMVALARADTPLTSNSSTFSVSRIGEGLDTQSRMAGLHYFMPAQLIPLVEVVLTEGRNRQVRRMTAAVGLPTLRLVRYAVGDWTVDGLQPGEWREITAPQSA